MCQITEKYCPTCDAKKSVGDFYKDTRRKDGYQYWCKACQYNSRKNAGPKKGITWTKAMKEILIAEYATADINELVKKLGLTKPLQVHCKAWNMKITGKRYGVNHRTKSLKKRKAKMKTEKSLPAKTKAPVLVKHEKQKYTNKMHRERPRNVEKKYQTRQFDTSSMVMLQIDKKTAIQVPINATEEQRAAIIARYQRKPLKAAC